MITRLKLSTIEQGLPKYRSMLAGNDAYIPTSFESIATATGTGSNATVTFSSIPSTYQHLQVRILLRDTRNFGTITTDTLSMVINSDTGANYTWHNLNGNGSTASATGTTGESKALTVRCVPTAFITADVFGAAIIDILDYKSTTKNKTIRSFGGCDGNNANTQFQIGMSSALWQSTSAITSISFTALTAWATNSTFALYGIKGA